MNEFTVDKNIDVALEEYIQNALMYDRNGNTWTMPDKSRPGIRYESGVYSCDGQAFTKKAELNTILGVK